MKKKVAKKAKAVVRAIEKDVMKWEGEVGEVVLAANTEIQNRGKAWEAKPIEFTKVTGGLQITINFKKNLKGNALRIKVTQTPQDWTFSLPLNHPVIEILGIVYYFGIA